MTFLELAKKILEEVKDPLTVEEIWLNAEKKGYDKQVSSKGKTPQHTLGAQLYVNVRDKQDSPFLKLGSRPSAFFLKQLMKGREKELLEKFETLHVQVAEKSQYLERDLHPFLAYHAYLFLKAFTKTIQH